VRTVRLAIGATAPEELPGGNPEYTGDCDQEIEIVNLAVRIISISGHGKNTQPETV